jgi:hypothetical protein
MSISREMLCAVLTAGTQAPSGDNLQPWRFYWDGEALSLILDRERDNSLFNTRQLASIVALGAAMENISLSSSSYGYRAEVQCFPEGIESDAIARVQFFPGAEPDPLAAAIFERCINRRPYTRSGVPSTEIVSRLTREIKPYPGIGIRWIADTKGLKELGRIASRGDRLLFENPKVHDYLFSTIRWNQDEVEKTRDGMPIAALELKGLDAVMFPKLKSWALVRCLNPFGLSRVAAAKNGTLFRSSSAAGLITVREISPRAFLEAGRAFQRVWLRATAEKLSFQPMTGFVLLQLRCHTGELNGLTSAQVKLLTSTDKRMATLFATEAGETQALLFRIGTAQAPSSRSLRRKLSDISNVS